MSPRDSSVSVFVTWHIFFRPLHCEAQIACRYKIWFLVDGVVFGIFCILGKSFCEGESWPISNLATHTHIAQTTDRDPFGTANEATTDHKPNPKTTREKKHSEELCSNVLVVIAFHCLEFFWRFSAWKIVSPIDHESEYTMLVGVLCSWTSLWWSATCNAML